MNTERIAALAALTGAPYLAGRTAFLAEEPPLPDYPYSLAEADPRFRVQYLILQGWQQNAALYQEIDAELRAIERNPNPMSRDGAAFMSASASGFSPLYNSFSQRSKETWQWRGLPYAWEMILKFEDMRPRWQIGAVGFMIRGFMHDNSIDAMLVAVRSEASSEVTRATAADILLQLPVAGLRERLATQQPYYIAATADLQEALRGR